MDTGRGYLRIRRLSAALGTALGTVSAALALAVIVGGCAMNRTLAPESYRVQRGDTLYAIGAEYGIDWHDLARWNRIARPYNLRVGQMLWLEPYPPINYANLPDKDRSSGESAAPAGRPGGTPTGRSGQPAANRSGPQQATSSAPPRDINPPTPTLRRTTERAPSRYDNLPAAGKPGRADNPASSTASSQRAPQASGSTAGTDSAGKAGDEGRIAQADKAASAAAAPKRAGGPSEDGWQWPATGSLIRQYNPDDGRQGIEIGGQLGAPVYAASSGTVVYNGSGLKGYGRLIIIKHDKHFLSAYGFNQRSLVTQGQIVAAGAHIADMGLGPANKPMLHFEIRRDGDPTNPVKVLPAH